MEKEKKIREDLKKIEEKRKLMEEEEKDNNKIIQLGQSVNDTTLIEQVVKNDKRIQCCFCLENKSESVFIPCGHRCVCFRCGEIIKEFQRKKIDQSEEEEDEEELNNKLKNYQQIVAIRKKKKELYNSLPFKANNSNNKLHSNKSSRGHLKKEVNKIKN